MAKLTNQVTSQSQALPPSDPFLMRGPRLSSIVDIDGNGTADRYDLKAPLPSGATSLTGLERATDFVTKHFGSGDLPVHVFFDPGTDDFPAVAYALLKGERFDLLSATVSYGNVSLEKTKANAVLLAALAKLHPDADLHRFHGIYEGAAGPLTGDVKEDASAEHGSSGLGDARVRFAVDEVQKLIATESVKANGPALVAADILSRYEQYREDPSKEPERVAFVAIGPLTDPYDILRRVADVNPKALSMIRGISIMGGGIDTGPGNSWHTNMTKYAEFNFYQDVEAAHRFFELLREHGNPIPVVIAPLDITHTTSVVPGIHGAYLEEAAKKRAESGSASAALGDLNAQLFSAIGSLDADRSRDLFKFPEARRFMHDPNAFTVLSRPELYDIVKVDVHVVAQGEQAGRLIVQSQPESNIAVIVSGDSAAIVEEWLRVLGS